MTTKKVVAMATEEPPDGDTVRAQVDTGRLKHSDSVTTRLASGHRSEKLDSSPLREVRLVTTRLVSGHRSEKLDSSPLREVRLVTTQRS